MKNTVVKVRVVDPTGLLVQGATVTARLNAVGISPSMGFYDRATIEGVTDELGETSLSLWPSADGSTDTQYRFVARNLDGSKIFEYLVTVPETEATYVWLHDILMLTAPTPKAYDEESINAIIENRVLSAEARDGAELARDEAVAAKNAVLNVETDAQAAADAAAASAVASKASADASALSATAAKGSEDKAKVSETNAKASEDNVAGAIAGVADALTASTAASKAATQAAALANTAAKEAFGKADAAEDAADAATAAATAATAAANAAKAQAESATTTATTAKQTADAAATAAGKAADDVAAFQVKFDTLPSEFLSPEDLDPIKADVTELKGIVADAGIDGLVITPKAKELLAAETAASMVDVLDLGTAASKDAQTAPNDSTAGHLMANGAHGLGGKALALSADAVTGFYAVTSTTEGPAADGTTPHRYVVINIKDDSAPAQLWFTDENPARTFGRNGTVAGGITTWRAFVDLTGGSGSGGGGDGGASEEQIAELQGQIDTLGLNLGNLTTLVGQVKATADQGATDIQALEGTVDGIQAQVDDMIASGGTSADVRLSNVTEAGWSLIRAADVPAMQGILGITAFLTSLNNLETEVGQAKGAATAASTAAGTAATDAATAKANAQAALDKANEVEAALDQTDVTALRTQVNALDVSVDGLSTRIDRLDNGGVDIPAKLSELETAMDAVQTKADTASTKADAAKTAADSATTGLTANEAKVDALDTRVAAVETGVTEAKSEAEQAMDKAELALAIHDSGGSGSGGVEGVQLAIGAVVHLPADDDYVGLLKTDGKVYPNTQSPELAAILNTGLPTIDKIDVANAARVTGPNGGITNILCEARINGYTAYYSSTNGVRTVVYNSAGTQVYQNSAEMTAPLYATKQAVWSWSYPYILAGFDTGAFTMARINGNSGSLKAASVAEGIDVLFATTATGVSFSVNTTTAAIIESIKMTEAVTISNVCNAGDGYRFFMVGKKGTVFGLYEGTWSGTVAGITWALKQALPTAAKVLTGSPGSNSIYFGDTALTHRFDLTTNTVTQITACPATYAAVYSSTNISYDGFIYANVGQIPTAGYYSVDYGVTWSPFTDIFKSGSTQIFNLFYDKLNGRVSTSSQNATLNGSTGMYETVPVIMVPADSFKVPVKNSDKAGYSYYIVDDMVAIGLPGTGGGGGGTDLTVVNGRLDAIEGQLPGIQQSADSAASIAVTAKETADAAVTKGDELTNSLSTLDSEVDTLKVDVQALKDAGGSGGSGAATGDFILKPIGVHTGWLGAGRYSAMAYQAIANLFGDYVYPVSFSSANLVDSGFGGDTASTRKVSSAVGFGNTQALCFEGDKFIFVTDGTAQEFTKNVNLSGLSASNNYVASFAPADGSLAIKGYKLNGGSFIEFTIQNPLGSTISGIFTLAGKDYMVYRDSGKIVQFSQDGTAVGDVLETNMTGVTAVCNSRNGRVFASINGYDADAGLWYPSLYELVGVTWTKIFNKTGTTLVSCGIGSDVVYFNNGQSWYDTVSNTFGTTSITDGQAATASLLSGFGDLFMWYSYSSGLRFSSDRGQTFTEPNDVLFFNTPLAVCLDATHIRIYGAPGASEADSPNTRTYTLTQDMTNAYFDIPVVQSPLPKFAYYVKS